MDRRRALLWALPSWYKLQEAVEQVGNTGEGRRKGAAALGGLCSPGTVTHALTAARPPLGAAPAPIRRGRPGPQCFARAAFPPASARPPGLPPLRRGCSAAPRRDWPAGLLVLPSRLSLAARCCHRTARLLRSQTVFPLGVAGSCAAHRARVGCSSRPSAQ